MNLYRSFGNLMEAWMNDGGQYSDSESQGNNGEDSPTPSSEMGTNLRSESVDSGVETASSDTSFPVSSCCVSPDIDTFTPRIEGESLTPTSTPQSPLVPSPAPSPSSSSSPRLRPNRSQESSDTLHLKLEKALERTDSGRLKEKPKPLTANEVLMRRPRASLLPKRHASELVKGQRSEGFDGRRASNISSSVTMRQTPGRRRPVSLSYERHPVHGKTKVLSEADHRGLSPGLSYLEQVCQMLEEIARQQMQSRGLQMETDALRGREEVEALDVCQSEATAAAFALEEEEEEEEEVEELSICQTLEIPESAVKVSSERQRKDNPRGHFRQRSASDTTLATLHLRHLNADRGQHLSTAELLERVEEEEQHEKQETKKETSKTEKNWRLKIGSLKKEFLFSSLRDSRR